MSEKVYHFRHEAMATHFECRVVHVDSEWAASLGGYFARELDRLESLLSRFWDGSDIFQINRLSSGQSLFLNEETYQCLRQAMELYVLTEGHFDVTVGAFMKLLRDDAGNSLSSSESDWTSAREAVARARLELHEERAAITCHQEGIELDLGGIGKGYALDCIRSEFLESGVKHFRLSAGGSTILCEGSNEQGEPWVSRLKGEQNELTIEVHQQSLSGSGYSVKGKHIVKKGSLASDQQYKRSWALADSAALSDALSTATILMTPDEIRACLDRLSGTARVWLESDSGSIDEVLRPNLEKESH